MCIPLQQVMSFFTDIRVHHFKRYAIFPPSGTYISYCASDHREYQLGNRVEEQGGNNMRKANNVFVIACFIMSLFTTVMAKADQPSNQTPYGHGDDVKPAHGVIGVVIQVAADRIGEPAALYVMKVRQDGPAHEAGLKHGDEIVAVNGTPVAGKSYDQVVSMIRGEAGTPVKLEVKGTRELSIMRVPSDKFTEGQPGPRGGQPEKIRP
jgi:carboxyl-terminal processing protease